jgi:hypothetical protein
MNRHLTLRDRDNDRAGNRTDERKSKRPKGVGKLALVPVGALRADPRNPRKHSRIHVRAIARSIEAFGFNAPILVDKRNQIRGIGPVYAKKMIKAFGEKVFDVIEAEPNRLREVTGIGAVRAKRITDAWAEQKIVREIMVFLHSNGVGTARAVRIFKTYGVDAVQVMTENPYRLARDIRGIPR